MRISNLIFFGIFLILLAIVKKILNDRNEQIEMKSQPGKGSVFSFTWTKKYGNEGY
jgi:signal transduction histidine kinase